MNEQVYFNTVDVGRFTVEVVRTLPYTGQLRVWVSDTKEELVNKEVLLSYDAKFGPDIEDVQDWKITAMQAINHWYRTHNLPIPE